PHGIDHDDAIFLGAEVVRLNDWIIKGVGTARVDVATALRSLLVEAECQPRELVEKAWYAFHIARRGKHHLDVRHIKFFPRFPESIGDRGRHRDCAAATNAPTRNFAGQLEALGGRIQSLNALYARHHPGRIVILKVVADAAKVEHHRHPELSQ